MINRAELAQWARGIKGRELSLSQFHGYICQREACSPRTREGAGTGSIKRVKSSGCSACPHRYPWKLCEQHRTECWGLHCKASWGTPPASASFSQLPSLAQSHGELFWDFHSAQMAFPSLESLVSNHICTSDSAFPVQPMFSPTRAIISRLS